MSHIIHLNKMKDIRIPNFELNNVLLTTVNKYKYLGHCISDDLSDDDDMTRQYRQIYAQGNGLLMAGLRGQFYLPALCLSLSAVNGRHKRARRSHDRLVT